MRHRALPVTRAPLDRLASLASDASRRSFALVLGLYVLLTFALSRSAGASFNGVDLSLRDAPATLRPFVAVAIALGYVLAYFLPGAALVTRRWEFGYTTRCFVASVLLHTAVLSMVKLFGGELTRTWFVFSSAALLLVLSLLKPPSVVPSSDPAERRALLPAGLLVVVVLLVFLPKLFLEDFAGDGTEHFEFARSLKTGLVPRWDLENGQWGFHHRFFFFAYPSVLSVLSVGEIEASVRLPGLVVLLLLLTLVLSWRAANARPNAVATAGVLAVFFLVCFVNFHYSTWDPWVADIAEPATTDLLGVYLCLASVRFMDGSRRWFVVCAVLACMAAQFGFVLMSLLLMIRLGVSAQRRTILVSAGAFGATYAAVLVIMRIGEIWFPRGATTSSLGNLFRYWNRIPDIQGFGLQLLFLVLMTGAVCVVTPLRRTPDEQTRTLWWTALAYSLLLATSSRINPHYFLAPAVLFATAFWRHLTVSARPLAAVLPTVASVAVCIWLVSPRHTEPFTRSSELGGRVRIAATDYQSRVALSPVIYEAFPFRQFGVGHHTLVYYAHRLKCRDCDYVIADTSMRVDGYTLSGTSGRSGLFRRHGHSEPRTSPPSSYCPEFLMRTYTAQRRRVEALLTGPTRLPWLLCLDRRGE